MRKKYPIYDELTHEWFWLGKWHDQYPCQEVDEYNESYDRYLEHKLDEKREEK